MNLRETTFTPLVLRRPGMRRVFADQRGYDVTLLQGLAKAFFWQHLVDSGEKKNASDIARSENLNPSVVSELMRLTLLAPDIVELLISGRQPHQMYLTWFQRNPLPITWPEQLRMLERFEGQQ